MAARRLLIMMLLVLAISTVGAALLAPRPQPQPAATTTTTQGSSNNIDGGQATGRLIEAGVVTGARRAERIRLRPGDQLELTVRSRTVGQVEVARFGALEDVGPNQPARFSLLLGEPVDFTVRLAGSRRVVARVEVTPQRAKQRPGRREADRSPR